MSFPFDPKHESGCPHVSHCPHAGGAAIVEDKGDAADAALCLRTAAKSTSDNGQSQREVGTKEKGCLNSDNLFAVLKL